MVFLKGLFFYLKIILFFWTWISHDKGVLDTFYHYGGNKIINWSIVFTNNLDSGTFDGFEFSADLVGLIKSSHNDDYEYWDTL